MMLEIIKWYSIVLLSVCGLANLWGSIEDKDYKDFISFLLIIPVIVYLVIK